MTDDTSMEVVTREQLLRVLPKKAIPNLTDDILTTLNSTISDPSFREIYRDNLIGFTSVIKEGKFKLQSYIDAVRYVSYASTGSNGVEAYSKTFPDRYQRLVADGASSKTISSYATTFKKTQLVQKIFEQSMIPIHIFNQDVFQKAINVQATLMCSAISEKVRSDAANSLMTHLKPPETKKIELDIGIKQDKTLNDFRDAAQILVKQQLAELESGRMSAKDVAVIKVISAEDIEDVN